MLALDTRENESYLEVRCTGALTIREAADAWKFFAPVWENPKTLIVNLAGISDLDTMGFQVLLYLKLRARGEGRKLHFVKHSTAVLAAMDLFGAVAEFGDKIHLSPADRKRFGFRYGASRAAGGQVH